MCAYPVASRVVNDAEAVDVIRRALEQRQGEWRANGEGEPSPFWIACVAVDALCFAHRFPTRNAQVLRKVRLG